MLIADFAAAFQYCHDLLRKPSRQQHAWLKSPRCRKLWDVIADSVGCTSPPPALPDDPQEYESRYIATFDAGMPHPPVPLIESHYNRTEPAPRLLHENMLFFQRFGLRLRSDFTETPDHLLCQLSFVIHLLALLQNRGHANQAEEGGQIIHAIGDYTDRHLRSWLPAAVAAAEDVPFQTAQSILVLVSCLVDHSGSLQVN